MIQKDCFTKEWIEQVKSNLNYPDVNLIEKVIRAFSLVEMLTMAGCPYIWKGGSSLMLLLAPPAEQAEYRCGHHLPARD